MSDININEKYQKKETIVVSSEKFTNGIEPPALTLMGLDKNGLGWKSPQESWSSFKFDEHCSKLNMTTIEDCVEFDTYNLTDIVKAAGYGLTHFDDSSPLNSPDLFWTEDLTAANMGKQFRLKSKKTHLTNSKDDMLITFLHNLTNFAVFVHAENFFQVNMNPLGPPSNMLFLKQPFENIYLEISCKMIMITF